MWLHRVGHVLACWHVMCYSMSLPVCLGTGGHAACTLTVCLMHACMCQLHYFLLLACPLTPASWTRWKIDDHPPRSSTHHRSPHRSSIIDHPPRSSTDHRSTDHPSIFIDHRSSIIHRSSIYRSSICLRSSIIDHRSSTDHPPISGHHQTEHTQQRFRLKCVDLRHPAALCH